MEKSIIIFVGDVGSYLADTAKSHCESAQLISEDNCENLFSGVYYTSLGEFVAEQKFIDTLSQAQTLIYCPPQVWSDQKNNDSGMKKYTEYHLMFFRDKTVVQNIDNLFHHNDIKQMLELVDQRKTNDQQLWIAGCSMSHGVGVETHERYGELLARRLELPVSFLTRSGSSIEWAADQILRSDLRSGDILVWGITAFSRFPYYQNEKINHIVWQYYQRYPEFNKNIPFDQLESKNQIYRSITAIMRVVNFCRKSNIKFCLPALLVDHESLKYMPEISEYLQLLGRFGAGPQWYLDYGNDNAHPGPKSHQWFAEQILEKLKF